MIRSPAALLLHKTPRCKPVAGGVRFQKFIDPPSIHAASCDLLTRGYLVDGKPHMFESDDDGDGFFESVMVFDPATGDFEMFIRHPDGTVKPLSTRAVEGIKKKKAEADEPLRKMLEDMSDDK